jgi:hypothetical protein
VSTFEEVSARHPYDLLVGDETYEIDMALDKRPELKKAPFVMIYDFVGLDAMTRNPLELLITYRGNWAWSGGPRGKPPNQEDLSLFIGELEDVAARPFGFLLPNRREYARRYYHFVGYAFPFDPADYTDRAKVRAALGYDDRPLIVCSVGGTAVGADLLRLCARAHPHIEERVGDVRMVLVCGPAHRYCYCGGTFRGEGARVRAAPLRAPRRVRCGRRPGRRDHYSGADGAA